MTAPAVLLVLAVALASPAAAQGGATLVPQTGARSNEVRASLEKIKLPPGFAISLYALVPSARHMAVGPRGRVTFIGTNRTRVYAMINIGMVVGIFPVSGLTLPFLLPYSAAQNMFGFERTFGEVVLYSANVWSYVTASENLRVWGHALRYFPHGEGETFLGFVPWFLAGVALVALLWPSAADPTSTRTVARWRTLAAAFLLFAVVTQFIAVMSVQ